MKIALIGYGKMGKAIHAMADEINTRNKNSELDICLIINTQNRNSISIETLKSVDVAIEFTTPETVVDNIKLCFDADIPVVIGSTGWTDQLLDIRSLALEQNKTFLFAPNFSIGVNIFFEINRYLAQLMNAHQSYDVSLEEIHHTEKKDAPSGTAIHAALDILKRIERKDNWVKETSVQPQDLEISSKRVDNVPGTHIVQYNSDIDKIELIHTAHNRKGFAEGALLAANWLKEKKGVYTMEDVLGFSK